MSQNIIAVNFNNQSLLATLVNDVPHVALKPICENLGLDWASQFSRIKRHPVLKTTIVMITTVAQDGVLREMLMMPIEYLNGWLFGIDSSRVKAEAKELVISYQRECFKVLANHFMPKVKTRKLSELTAKERQDLVVNRWVVFVDIYGSQLTNQYNYDIPDVWGDVLGNLSSEDFERGIEAIKNSGSPYMPKLPVFIAYCKDAEVVTAKEGLTISEMKEKLGLPCENRADMLKHVEFQDIRIKVCTELLQGMKHSAEIMKGVLKA